MSGRRVQYFPDQPTLDNYVDLFANNPFALYFRNSTIIATGNMLLTLIVASLKCDLLDRFRNKIGDVKGEVFKTITLRPCFLSGYRCT